eukprot:3119444-Amphidinium_carterae.1
MRGETQELAPHHQDADAPGGPFVIKNGSDRMLEEMRSGQYKVIHVLRNLGISGGALCTPNGLIVDVTLFQLQCA